jgi:hypothetical protein
MGRVREELQGQGAVKLCSEFLCTTSFLTTEYMIFTLKFSFISAYSNEGVAM